jgi:hypothetical protein
MYATSEMTEILAINTQVKITRPSPEHTISEPQFAKLYLNGKAHYGRRPIKG